MNNFVGQKCSTSTAYGGSLTNSVAASRKTSGHVSSAPDTDLLGDVVKAICGTANDASGQRRPRFPCGFILEDRPKAVVTSMQKSPARGAGGIAITPVV